jgi:hypothetical protein
VLRRVVLLSFDNGHVGALLDSGAGQWRYLAVSLFMWNNARFMQINETLRDTYDGPGTQVLGLDGIHSLCYAGGKA